MIMKVFNKGQVVIPARIRKTLGIEIGDVVDVEINPQKRSLELKVTDQKKAKALAGCFRKYKKNIPFPSRKKMHETFTKGLMNEK